MAVGAWVASGAGAGVGWWPSRVARRASGPLEGGEDQVRGALDVGWRLGEARGYQVLES